MERSVEVGHVLCGCARSAENSERWVLYVCHWTNTVIQLSLAKPIVYLFCFLRCGRGLVPGSSKDFQSTSCHRPCHCLNLETQQPRRWQSPKGRQPLSSGRKSPNHKHQVHLHHSDLSLQSFLTIIIILDLPFRLLARIAGLHYVFAFKKRMCQTI